MTGPVRRPLRALLTGLEQPEPKAVPDQIESTPRNNGTVHGERRTFAARTIGPPSIGAGLGRSSGGSWRKNLAPTPELLARVAALRPVRDTAMVDLDSETRHQPRFTLTGLLREFRRPLLLGLVLVVLDALASLAGPVLVKTGVDNGVSAGSQAVLFAAAHGLAIGAAD